MNSSNRNNYDENRYLQIKNYLDDLDSKIGIERVTIKHIAEDFSISPTAARNYYYTYLEKEKKIPKESLGRYKSIIKPFKTK